MQAGLQVPAGEVKALVDDLAAFDPDLAGEEDIGLQHISEASRYRLLDKMELMI